VTARAQASKRKTSAELAAIRALIAEAVPSEEWLPILRRLAQSNNPRLIELLMKYRFGLPVAPASSDPVRAGRYDTLRMHLRADAENLVRISLPGVDGDDGLEAASGTADAVSPKRGGRAAVRRGGGRRQK
jgi:hypothetical protein